MKRKTLDRTLRIIGGDWRGRQISFADLEDIRPTPNRIRETLFNWLSSVIADARCLELFAGSGILSLEALSRQAKEVMIIDQSPKVIELIQQHLSKMNPYPKATLWRGDAWDWLRDFDEASAKYNIAFVDPPFRTEMIPKVCELLEQHRVLSADALIYIESASVTSQQSLPSNWEIHRQQKAGQVHFCLCKRITG
jgi:16S rRNA (guanine966-N2)-methyltransferase|tara:strand:+ start:2591 stop:3175 length:585 start_codon:yes stop_codon:yes gene_type:complete